VIDEAVIHRVVGGVGVMRGSSGTWPSPRSKVRPRSRSCRTRRAHTPGRSGVRHPGLPRGRRPGGGVRRDAGRGTSTSRSVRM
jgi:hypothetical protein